MQGKQAPAHPSRHYSLLSHQHCNSVSVPFVIVIILWCCPHSKYSVHVYEDKLAAVTNKPPNVCGLMQ